MIDEAQIKQRIAELEQEYKGYEEAVQAFISEANDKLSGYRGAIRELRRLLAPVSNNETTTHSETNT